MIRLKQKSFRGDALGVFSFDRLEEPSSVRFVVPRFRQGDAERKRQI